MSLASAESAVSAGGAHPSHSSSNPLAHRLASLVEATIKLFFSRRFATFIVFGGLAAVVNLGVGKMLYSVPSFASVVPYWLAVAAGALSGLAVNFTLNYAFNFKYGGRPAAAQLRTFIVVALGGGVLMVLIAHGLVWLAGKFGLTAPLEVAGVTLQIGFIAHVIATGVLTFYSFAAHSLFSFNVGLRARLRRAFPAAAWLQRTT
jgi:putative flippase GtrA